MSIKRKNIHKGELIITDAIMQDIHNTLRENIVSKEELLKVPEYEREYKLLIENEIDIFWLPRILYWADSKVKGTGIFELKHLMSAEVLEKAEEITKADAWHWENIKSFSAIKYKYLTQFDDKYRCQVFGDLFGKDKDDKDIKRVFVLDLLCEKDKTTDKGYRIIEDGCKVYNI